MLLIGLTGGIGSGKSTVAAAFAARGAIVIDADQIAREVVAAGTDGLAEIVAQFGEEVLGDDGELDRPALGKIVFGDDEARATLNDITHPRIGEVTFARFAEIAEMEPPERVVVHDVPLLVEGGMAASYEYVVVVLADEERRIQRLQEHRGMDPDDARSRMRVQASDDDRRAVATHVITNDGDLDELERQVDAVWSAIRAIG